LDDQSKNFENFMEKGKPVNYFFQKHFEIIRWSYPERISMHCLKVSY